MPLPPPRKAGLRAGRQIHVELYEIPLPGVLEIPCRERPYASPTATAVRRRWAFFTSLLKFINAIKLFLRDIKNISTRWQFLLPEEPRQPIILCCKTGGIIELLLRFQRGSPQIE